MKLTELIDRLQVALDVYGDREVLVAQQPSWPLAATVVNVWDPLDELHQGDPDFDEDDDESGSDEVWLAITECTWGSDNSPYAPRAAWES